ncbi:MAG: hypothetical protein ACE5HQ_13390, partial [Gemmatimonadota bacterium]
LGPMTERLPHGSFLPPDLPAPDRSVERAVLWLGAAVGVLVCLSFGLDVPIVWKDNQHYFFMAERAAHGVPPYLSTFDPKNALALLLSGAAIRLGELVGLGAVASARLLSVGAFGLSSGLVGLLALRLTRSRLVAALSVLGLLSLTYLGFMAAVGARPKVFLVLFMSGALVAVERERLGRAALASVLAFLCWQPAAVLWVGVLAVAGFRPHLRRRIPSVLLAGALPVLAYEAYFLALGALPAQMEQSVRFPARFMSHEFPGVLAQLSSLKWIWSRGYGIWNPLPVVFVLSLGALAASASRRWRSEVSGVLGHAGWLYFDLMMVLWLAMTFYDHQGPPDLFPLAPFLAVVSALGVASLVSGLARRFGPAVRTAAAVAAVALFVLNAAAGVARRRAFMDREVPYRLTDQIELGRQVGRMLAAGERIYAVGATHLLALNHVSNCTVFGSIFRGVEEYLVESGGGPVYAPRCDAGPPTTILWSYGRLPGWPAWVEAGYEERTTPSFRVQGIRVWTLRPSPGGEGEAEVSQDRDTSAAGRSTPQDSRTYLLDSNAIAGVRSRGR